MTSVHDGLFSHHVAHLLVRDLAQPDLPRQAAAWQILTREHRQPHASGQPDLTWRVMDALDSVLRDTSSDRHPDSTQRVVADLLAHQLMVIDEHQATRRRIPAPRHHPARFPGKRGDAYEIMALAHAATALLALAPDRLSPGQYATVSHWLLDTWNVQNLTGPQLQDALSVLGTRVPDSHVDSLVHKCRMLDQYLPDVPPSLAARALAQRLHQGVTAGLAPDTTPHTDHRELAKPRF